MRKGPDILRRFTALPYVATASVFGRAIRLETNSQSIFRLVRSTVEGYRPVHSLHEDFVWRFVSDPDAKLAPPWPDFSSLSRDGLHCENIGQKSFLAVDAAAHLAVGFLAQELVNDALGFEVFFLSRLITATSPALGLLPFSAACVAKAGKGLLLVSAARAGKTILSYAASKNGLQLHSDHVVFLESAGQKVAAWRDCWPLTFYPGAEKLFPELSNLSRPVQQQDSMLLCLERYRFSAPLESYVHPLGIVVLQKDLASLSPLHPLDPSEAMTVLKEHCLLGANELCEPKFENTLRGLTRLPIYGLASYGDPCALVSSLLSLLEATA
ncbi:MAG TPA: hypothetical protein VFD30_00505 [Terriglobia bacterium]|nr:hypothetical protein [Terriglobia bacterium]